jgi:hypothetical protein
VAAEPDLDQPGRPLDGKTLHADGTWSPHPIQQTKRDNCASAAHQAGGLDNVTDALLSEWNLTRREYNEFRMDHARALAAMEMQRDYYDIMLREFPPGPPEHEKYIDTLKLLMPDDWQNHVPPE